jgi:hypothetical protein
MNIVWRKPRDPATECATLLLSTARLRDDPPVARRAQRGEPNDIANLAGVHPIAERRLLQGRWSTLVTGPVAQRGSSGWIGAVSDAPCPSPISRPGKKSLPFAQLLARLRAMSETFRTVSGLRSALSTRRDLLFENLALRHQRSVQARSDRRFRPCDRLLWLCLRRVWLRWRDALMLVQPATVPRWHREGFRGFWSRRLRRRPGRPRIDSELRALIRRMTTANRLWGAPRIHGE